MCIAIGFFSLVFGYFAKFVPLSYFKGLKLNEEPIQMTGVESLRHSFRQSRTLSRSYTQKVLGASSTGQKV